MASKKTIRQYNKELERHAAAKHFLTISHIFFDHALRGFVLSVSEKFLLLQLTHDFILDGYAIISIHDFDSYRYSAFEKTSRKIFQQEGLIDKVGFDKELKLDDWAGILTMLKQYDYHVIIESDRKKEMAFHIGEVKKVTAKTVYLQHYSANGKWDKKATAIKLKDIRIVHFGDNYSTCFKRYMDAQDHNK